MQGENDKNKQLNCYFERDYLILKLKKVEQIKLNI